jgi:hypothetical protein
MRNVYIGFDAREHLAWGVCAQSMLEHASKEIVQEPVSATAMRAFGLYTRPESRRDGVAWDEISNAPMSTDFSLSRFFVCSLKLSGWSLFCDCDFLFRDDVCKLFALADKRYAVMCVQHDHQPVEAVKMDGQVQTVYPRKNWSSLMLINHAHPSVQALTADKANSLTGLELHGFSWLRDHEIGALPTEWNWLEGSSNPRIEPKAVHFTRGTPDMKGYESVPYANEWWNYARR